MFFDDEDFAPSLGKMRGLSDARRTRKYLSRVLQSANLARGGASTKGSSSRFTGARTGRGSGVGRVLGSRDRFAFARTRRVIIKSRIVRLGAKGLSGAQAHLRYLQRDGTTRDGERGALYNAGRDDADGRAFLERGADERHQFRFIVSPEDGDHYEDLKRFTRRLMTQMEEDLGTRLDWVAVDHFNTGHPHSHVIVRGKDELGQDLVIARDYIGLGMRERAAEIVSLDLGPRTDEEIEQRLRAEVTQERFTSIDRALLREADTNRTIGPTGRDAFEQALRTGRLQTLGKLGLATPAGPARWQLVDDLQETLTRMGERGDIIRTMQREITERGLDRAEADRSIYDPTKPETRPLTGRVIGRGLSDELNDRHYLVVDATDGRAHYIEVGRTQAIDGVAPGTIVRVEPQRSAIRQADRTVVAVARANGGQYDVDAHLKHDPSATQAFAETHVRRLEAIRRANAGVERQPDGSWAIPPDHLDRVAVYEAARIRDQPVSVTVLATQPLDRLAREEAATLLDRNLVDGSDRAHRDQGFGRELRDAEIRRRQWLVEQGVAEEHDGATRYRPTMLADLQRREVLRVAGQLSTELGLDFTETKSGETISGTIRRSVELTSGKFTLIERSRDFTLVPWRPTLERQLGKPISGVMRGDGINWTIGRTRGGLSV